jgi:hypothetical protein
MFKVGNMANGKPQIKTTTTSKKKPILVSLVTTMPKIRGKIGKTSIFVL